MGKEVKSGGDEKKPAAAAAAAGGATTVVLKLDLHCEGCAQKIKRSIRHLTGVESVRTDLASNKLTVTGKVDPAKVKEKAEEKSHKKVDIVSPLPPKNDSSPGSAAGDKKPDENKPDKKNLAPSLKDKLKRAVEVVLPKKEAVSGRDDKKVEKKAEEKASGGEKKMEKETGAGERKESEKKVTFELPKEQPKAASGDAKKVEVMNKMEYGGYSPYSHYTAPIQSLAYAEYGYGVPAYNHNQGYVNPGYSQDYHNQDYMEYSRPPPPMPVYAHAPPEMFMNDENPNACSIM